MKQFMRAEVFFQLNHKIAFHIMRAAFRGPAR